MRDSEDVWEEVGYLDAPISDRIRCYFRIYLYNSSLFFESTRILLMIFF